MARLKIKDAPNQQVIFFTMMFHLTLQTLTKLTL